MKQKLQVFVSSTYTDLVVERQAAVQAILNAGHIPAGMELFSAGDQSQLETVKRWIDESDVFLLILGGRYGSIEPNTQLGYIEVEYDYATEKRTPAFAVVMSDKWIEERVKQQGSGAMELDNRDKYTAFRNKIMSRICRKAEDKKDIQIAIHETLQDFRERYSFDGWVSGKEVRESRVLEQMTELAKENQLFKEEVEKLSEQLKGEIRMNGFSYSELKSLLKNRKVRLPNQGTIPLLKAFTHYRSALVSGVTNAVVINALPSDSVDESFLFHEIAAPLLEYGLVERAKVPGALYMRLQLSNEGGRFLLAYDLERQREI